MGGALTQHRRAVRTEPAAIRKANSSGESTDRCPLTRQRLHRAHALSARHASQGASAPRKPPP